MSILTVNLIWIAASGIVLSSGVILFGWYQGRSERRQQAVLRANSDLMRRIESLSLQVAVLDVKGPWFDLLPVEEQNYRVAEHRSVVLKTVADDLERYLRGVE
jgi:hypothetical protein